MRRWNSESAMGQAVTFLVAGAVFVASMGAVLMASQEGPQAGDHAERTGLGSQGHTILETLMGSPGVQSPGGDWERFGLLEEGGGLSRTSMDALCGAGIESADDSKAQYNEVAASLGLDTDDGVRFHLSIAPADGVDIQIGEYRLAYIEAMPAAAEIKTPDLGDADSEDDVQDAYDALVDSNVIEERQAIAGLGVEFDDRPNLESNYIQPVVENWLGLSVDFKDEYPGADLGGDVYPDDPFVIDSLDLDPYNILFVGSGVDLENLYPLTLSVQDWVLAGGIVVMMGGSNDDADWLSGLFARGDPNNAPLEDLPYDEHPVFNQPFQITPENYVDVLAPAVYETGLMEHLLTAGDPPDQDSHLALSRCGAFGDGFVGRSSYDSALRLGEDADEDGGGSDRLNLKLQEFMQTKLNSGQQTKFEQGITMSTEAPYPLEYFLANWIHYAILQGLYLKVGPVPPDDAVIVHDERLSWVDDPLYGAIPMKVQISAWEA